jgi:hypothetical protein
MAHHGEFVLERRPEHKIMALRRSVNRLKLRLDFQGAKPILFAAPPNFTSKLSLPRERIEARRTHEPVAVSTYCRANLIVRFAVRPDHRKWDRERPIDSITIHSCEHRVRTMNPPAVQRFAHMAVRIEDPETVAHLLNRPHDQ